MYLIFEKGYFLQQYRMFFFQYLTKVLVGVLLGIEQEELAAALGGR